VTGRRKKRDLSLAEENGYWRGQFEAMASPCEVLCEASGRSEAYLLTEIVAREVWRVEDKFSRYRAGNVVDRINSAKGKAVEVDPETAQLIDFGVTLHQISDRRFDITSGVLRRVWKFDGSSDIPVATEIETVLKDVGWHQVLWESPRLTMRAGMELDFGGIGKEFAVDRAIALLRGESSVSCLVNLGGDLAVTSRPGQRDTWKVGIEATSRSTHMPASLLNLQIGALATSGDARRFLLKDGVRYSHILDPQTGWPIQDAPRSITVAADTCTQAGMLSTLAVLQGKGAESFLDAQGVKFWCDRGAQQGGGSETARAL
jgi:thiamine biosynthesis lipoprotein